MLLLGQPLHRDLQQIADFIALDHSARIELRVGDLGHDIDILGARLATQIDAAVADDAIEPG